MSQIRRQFGNHFAGALLALAAKGIGELVQAQAAALAQPLSR